jgi:hypothetical protein
MQQRQHALEHVQRGGREVVGHFLAEARLDQLEVPVAHLAPEHAVELEHRGGQLVGLD